jgi:hypothetical protein
LDDHVNVRVAACRDDLHSPLSVRCSMPTGDQRASNITLAKNGVKENPVLARLFAKERCKTMRILAGKVEEEKAIEATFFYANVPPRAGCESAQSIPSVSLAAIRGTRGLLSIRTISGYLVWAPSIQ